MSDPCPVSGTGHRYKLDAIWEASEADRANEVIMGRCRACGQAKPFPRFAPCDDLVAPKTGWPRRAKKPAP